MKRSYITFLAAAIFLSAAFQSAGQELNFFPDQVMVQLHYKKNIDGVLEKLNNDFPGANLKINRVLSKRLNIYLLEFDDSRIDHSVVLRSVSAHPLVAIAQYNHTDVENRIIPNDPSFGSQWNMLNNGVNGNVAGADVDADSAWDITTGGLTARGDTIVVAIVDDGFFLGHEDLAFWKNHQEIPGNGIDDDNNGYIDDVNGWNAYDNDGNISSSFHGTHVSGISGATGDNNLGVAGVSWNVKIMAIQGSSGVESTVVAAYDYALTQRIRYDETAGDSGAFVVSTNSSFGVDEADPADYPIWCAFYDSLGTYGILSAGATMNKDLDVDVTGDVPTACPSNYMIAVTNTTSSDTKNTGAAYGATTIDIGAPGTGILSTTPNNNYGNATGTSMASPHVAGAVGLMYAAACEQMFIDYENDPAGLAMLMRDYMLTQGFDANASLDGITTTGGRLDLYKCLLAVQSYICYIPMNFTSSTVDDTCGACAGSASVSVSEGVPPYTYLWDDPQAQTTSTATGLCAGTYSVIVSDSVTSDTVTIVLAGAAPVSAALSSQVSSCGGSDGSAEIVFSGGTSPYAYVWNDPDGQTSSTATGLPAGVYTVTVSDNIGCDNVYNTSVNNANNPTAVIDSVWNVDCYGNENGGVFISVTSGSGPYTYLWSNGQTTDDITGLSGDTHSVEIDSAGCKTFLFTSVSEPDSLAITLTETNISCFGNLDGNITTTVSGGTAPYVYFWSNNETTEDITGLAEGFYTLTLTDDNGCVTTGSGAVYEPLELVAGLTVTNAHCNDASAGIIDAAGSGGISPYSYQWSNGSTSSSITGLTAGTYDVTITDNNGCTATASGTVYSSIIIGNMKNNVTCYGGSDGSIQLSVYGGIDPYSYDWSNGDTTSFNTDLTAGVYEVTVTDNENCTNTASVNVLQPLEMVLDITVQHEDNGNDGSVTVDASGGNPGPYFYLWSDGQTNSTASGLAGGTYWVTVTDGAGCIVSDSAVVTAVGIAQNEHFMQFKIYPNPNDGNFTLQFDGISSGEHFLEMKNVLGQVVYRDSFDASPGLQHITLSLDHLSKEMYFLRIMSRDAQLGVVKVMLK